ncbi:uncharacterized protein LOC111385481 isoform X2 [Olea europaea var. sylvestris]|uniref:uncharacterized protein LOC111385481 isoform X2 n=1 Tax=Olea europaea var. sylvestris TaxID=158386 RepID=UPI000C1D77A3|nr:uncharacterized protein LOC111385481 isoform X2 [Olea europaea var. sylvestris]
MARVKQRARRRATRRNSSVLLCLKFQLQKLLRQPQIISRHLLEAQGLLRKLKEMGKGREKSGGTGLGQWLYARFGNIRSHLTFSCLLLPLLDL